MSLEGLSPIPDAAQAFVPPHALSLVGPPLKFTRRFDLPGYNPDPRTPEEFDATRKQLFLDIADLDGETEDGRKLHQCKLSYHLAEYGHRNEVRKFNGVRYFQHPLNVVRKVNELNLRDPDTIQMGFMHDLHENTNYLLVPYNKNQSFEEWEALIDQEVAKLEHIRKTCGWEVYFERRDAIARQSLLAMKFSAEVAYEVISLSKVKIPKEQLAEYEEKDRTRLIELVESINMRKLSGLGDRGRLIKAVDILENLETIEAHKNLEKIAEQIREIREEYLPELQLTKGSIKRKDLAEQILGSKTRVLRSIERLLGVKGTLLKGSFEE